MDEYKGWESWTNQQWSWEFLRRNTEYGDICSKFDNNNCDIKKINRTVQKKFGLLEYKSCHEPFSALPSITPPRFVSVDIRSYARVTRKQIDARAQSIKINIYPGEVIIKFDVTKLHFDVNLDSQIDAAKKRLKNLGTEWQKRKKESAIKNNPRNHFFLLPLLVLLDLDRCKKTTQEKIVRLTNSEIYWKLFPFTLAEKRDTKAPIMYGSGIFDKEFQAAKKKALSYTEMPGYLALAATPVTLPVATDWIQLHSDK